MTEQMNHCEVCGTRWAGGLPEHDGICPHAEDHPRCSACGSDAPHHVAYVAEHGVCVA